MEEKRLPKFFSVATLCQSSEEGDLFCPIVEKTSLEDALHIAVALFLRGCKHVEVFESELPFTCPGHVTKSVAVFLRPE